MDGTKDGSGRAKYDRVVALAHLDPIAYDQQRGGAAKKMGVRLSTLDREVARCRAALGKKPSTPEEKPDLAKLAASAKRITECEDVLALFAQDFSQLVAGEEKNAKALYLVGTSRLFRKPMHVRATIDHDYRAVRSLMGDVLAASAEVQISKRIAETIAAVKKTQPTDKNKGASVRAVAQELKLDRTPTWRRLGAAEQAGHLVNVEQRRGRPGQYRTLAGQDPAGEEILPTCAALREAVRERRKARSK